MGGLDWVKNTNEMERFLNLTLSLIHPDLFRSGLLMLHKLRELEATREVAKEWQSVFTGISVISNRVTPPHRDSKGRAEWFDVLINYCSSKSSPHLLIKDLGLDLKYSTGTLVGFCGLVLEHEVKAWGSGDRVCLAHFMREKVGECLNAPPAGWVNKSIYFPNAL
jgi:2-oxoglutarate-Fe(II)-dependent dioxygenase family protein